MIACVLNSSSRDPFSVAREEKKFLMEAMWTRYFPASKKLTEIISNGELGEIVSFRGQFGFELVGRDVARLIRPDLGGGALVSLAFNFSSHSPRWTLESTFFLLSTRYSVNTLRASKPPLSSNTKSIGTQQSCWVMKPDKPFLTLVSTLVSNTILVP